MPRQSAASFWPIKARPHWSRFMRASRLQPSPPRPLLRWQILWPKLTATAPRALPGAMATLDHRGTAVAAINVTGPEASFAPDQPRALAIREAVAAAAAEISRGLGYLPRK